MDTSGRTRRPHLDGMENPFSMQSLMSATSPKCSDTGAYELVTPPACYYKGTTTAWLLPANAYHTRRYSAPKAWVLCFQQRSAGIETPPQQRGCRTDKNSHSILHTTLTSACERTVIPLQRRGCYINYFNYYYFTYVPQLRSEGVGTTQTQAPVLTTGGLLLLYSILLAAFG